jgi:cytochrome b involved in lipid metabolism
MFELSRHHILYPSPAQRSCFRDSAKAVLSPHPLIQIHAQPLARRAIRNQSSVLLVASSNMSSIHGAEVAKHNSKKSCWILLDSKVYDVTSFLSKHPGGAAIILKQAGSVRS